MAKILQMKNLFTPRISNSNFYKCVPFNFLIMITQWKVDWSMNGKDILDTFSRKSFFEILSGNMFFCQYECPQLSKKGTKQT